MDNKLLVSISSIESQQASTNECTNEAVNKILNYSAIYPAGGILYCSSDMVLCANSDTVFHNKSKGNSRSGAHIFLSENNPMIRWNGLVLTLAQIIKFVMSSASEAELGAIFSTAREIAATRNTLEEM